MFEAEKSFYWRVRWGRELKSVPVGSRLEELKPARKVGAQEQRTQKSLQKEEEAELQHKQMTDD